MIVSASLMLTVVTSVSIGIYAGYAAVSGILFIFGRRHHAAPAPAPALVTSTEQKAQAVASS
jgi:hypothetical protein